jgi:hypothetical protein
MGRGDMSERLPLAIPNRLNSRLLGIVLVVGEFGD